MSDLFKGNVPESQLDVRVINGEDISKESILGAIQKAEVRTEDTLLFYYSGHGAFDSEKKQYIQLPGGVPLLRSDVDAELNQKNAHLKVLLTDTCSTFYSINKSSKSDHRKKVPRQDLAADRVSPLFQAIFFETNGYVSISGTKPGESGFMDLETAEHKTRGSLFTFPFVDFLNGSRDRRLEWAKVVEDVTPLVKKAFYDRFHGQGFRDENGQVVQTEQTVWTYSLPDSKKPGDRKVVFGARVGANPGGGLKVFDIVPGSPAQKLGLEKGDLIDTINGQPVNNLQAYGTAVDNSPRQMVVTGRDGKTLKAFKATATLNK